MIMTFGMLSWKLKQPARDREAGIRCEYNINDCLCYLQFDPEGFGEIPWPDFLQTLQNPDFIAQVPPHKREVNNNWFICNITIVGIFTISTKNIDR